MKLVIAPRITARRLKRSTKVLFNVRLKKATKLLDKREKIAKNLKRVNVSLTRARNELFKLF